MLSKNLDRKINICGLLKYCYRKKKMLYVIVIFLSIVVAVGQQYIVNQNNISYVDNYEREINNANKELSEVESRIDYLQNYYNSAKETYINGSNNIVHKDIYLIAEDLNADTKSMILNNISDINGLDIDWDLLTHEVGFDDVDLINELIKIGVHEDYIGVDVFCSTEEKGNIVTEYLVNAINNKYNVPINIIGSSFGGYIALLYVMKHDIINKVFLKYPAVNFCECVDRKLNINSKYFDNTEYIELPSGYRIYKKSYESFNRNNIMNNYSTNSEIYIIHGTLDKTVLLDDVKRIAVDNSIKLKIVDGASHGMKDYLDLVNEEIINYFK